MRADDANHRLIQAIDSVLRSIGKLQNSHSDPAALAAMWNKPKPDDLRRAAAELLDASASIPASEVISRYSRGPASDEAKVTRIAAAIANGGWRGKPLIAYRKSGGMLATGTHRLDALKRGIRDGVISPDLQIPIYALEAEPGVIWRNLPEADREWLQDYGWDISDRTAVRELSRSAFFCALTGFDDFEWGGIPPIQRQATLKEWEALSAG
jgi:hypothetical protein